MTAVMVGPDETTSLERPAPDGAPATTRLERPESAEVRALLLELRSTLDAQRRTLDALDARREQLDELIADAMPIANAALLMATRTAGSLDERIRSFAPITAELDAVRRAPAPGLLALLRRLRDRDVRKAVALAIEGLRVVGRLADGDTQQPVADARTIAEENPHQGTR